MKHPYSVADGRALVTRLDVPDRDVVGWLCDRIEELEAQLGANMGQVEGVCSICGKAGWYMKRGLDDQLLPSSASVVGLIGSSIARILAGQTVLRSHDGVLICTVCLKKPT